MCATGCGSPPARLSSPNLSSGSDAPEASTSDSDVQVVVTKHLNRVVRAMAPVCGDRCGTVGAIPDPSLTSGAETRPSLHGFASLVLYRPDSECVRESEDFVFYCWAHEYGHHLDATMFDNDSEDPWVHEIHADALAGCAFARAGLSLESLRVRAERAIRRLPPIVNRWALACGADDTHPHWSWTLLAAQRGAEECSRPGATVPLVLEAADVTIAEARETAASERQRLPKAFPCRRE